MNLVSFRSRHMQAMDVVLASRLPPTLRAVSSNLLFQNRTEEALTYLLGAKDAVPTTTPLYKELKSVREAVKLLVR